MSARFATAPTRAHDLVTGNLLTALHVPLRGRDRDVHGSNLKVVSPAGMVAYPDVFVHCGPLEDELSLEALGIGLRLTKMYAGTRASG
jgi:hypothetical protein